MESPDLGTVQKALSLIEQAMTERSHATAAVPYFAPTELGGLPPTMQEAELQKAEEIAYGNRLRAGIHAAMAAARTSLRVCEALMQDTAELDYRARQKQMLRCATDAQAASKLAEQASAILQGREAPKTDAATEIKKLTAAVYERFGQLARKGP